ncbi:POL3 [Hepatospora eriocheir]|uniref:POL3 n=1 Tax=Hepatospora eriocheir TaxID=1081669 RepID=A0A1X0QIK4_9MICR|nr:POL3 [Hepatospora eriocheir]
MEDIFDTISKTKIRLKLDIGKTFHQIDVHPDDIPKTAFACKFGIFEWTKMPFGLVNGSAMFQRNMDIILKDYLWKFVVVYINDIIIYLDIPEEHQKHVAIVKEILSKHGFSLNEDKCEFFKDKLQILGHVISNEGIKPSESKIEAINNTKL